jgi:hypothetical protein
MLYGMLRGVSTELHHSGLRGIDGGSWRREGSGLGRLLTKCQETALGANFAASGRHLRLLLLSDKGPTYRPLTVSSFTTFASRDNETNFSYGISYNISHSITLTSTLLFQVNHAPDPSRSGPRSRAADSKLPTCSWTKVRPPKHQHFHFLTDRT